MIPDARDHSEQGDDSCSPPPVPSELMEYLVKHAESLAPELRDAVACARARSEPARGPKCSASGAGGRRALHGLALRAIHAARRRRRQGRVSAADVRQRRADPSRLSARPVSERRSVAAPARRVARGRAGDRLHRAGHLFPDVRRVDAPLRARRESALRARGPAQSRCGGQRPLRLRRARRARVLSVRHRVDRRAGRRPAGGQLRHGGSAHAADPRITRAAARWPDSSRNIPTIGSRNRSA